MAAVAEASVFDLKLSMTVHAIGGVVVLLLPSVLAIYKRAGKTQLARRARFAPAGMAQGSVARALPRWVRAAARATLP